MFKLNQDDPKAKFQFTHVSFPQPATPHVDYKTGPTKIERMSIQHQYESANLARIHCSSASSGFTCIKRSETDLVGMSSIERNKSDTGYNSHAHYFLGKVRQGANPLYATEPLPLRLDAECELDQ